VAFALAGCAGEERPNLVSVTGKVVDGPNAVTAGAIYFHPAETNAYTKDNPSSLLQLDGSFTMKTFPFGEGVSPGKYKVTLAPEVAARVKEPRYGDPKTTPWEVTVPNTGLKDQLFEVTGAKK
jgi:hypothetical protein